MCGGSPEIVCVDALKCSVAVWFSEEHAGLAGFLGSQNPREGESSQT